MFGPRITSIPGCRSRQLRLTRNHISQCHHLAHSPHYRAVIKYICVGGQPLSFFNFRFVLPKIIRWGQNNRWLFCLVVTKTPFLEISKYFLPFSSFPQDLLRTLFFLFLRKKISFSIYFTHFPSSNISLLFCSSQPSMVHWLSSSIFPFCLFVCSFVRPSRYGNIRPNLRFFSIYTGIKALY